MNINKSIKSLLISIIVVLFVIIKSGCADIVGPMGPAGPPGPSGIDGIDGSDGVDGLNGVDGINGVDGKDGADGKDGVLEVIVPCNETRPYPEVLFRLSDGLLYAVYADTKNSKIHLARIPPGRYITTDGYGCLFTVTEDNQVIWVE